MFIAGYLAAGIVIATSPDGKVGKSTLWKTRAPLRTRLLITTKLKSLGSLLLRVTNVSRSCCALLVVDTRVSHTLTDGGYASRRTDCESAARVLGVSTLREAQGRVDAIDRDVLGRRCIDRASRGNDPHHDKHRAPHDRPSSTLRSADQWSQVPM